MPIRSQIRRSATIQTTFISLVLMLFLLLYPNRLHAATLNYNYAIQLTQITCTSTCQSVGEFSGTGVITITQGGNPTPGNYGYGVDTPTLTAMTFTLDTGAAAPSTYSLAHTTGNDVITLGSAFSASSSPVLPNPITAVYFEGTNSSDGGYALDINFSSDGTYAVYDDNYTTRVATGTWDVSSEYITGLAPEPASILLLGSGVLGGFRCIYRRRRAA